MNRCACCDYTTQLHIVDIHDDEFAACTTEAVAA